MENNYNGNNRSGFNFGQQNNNPFNIQKQNPDEQFSSSFGTNSQQQNNKQFGSQQQNNFTRPVQQQNSFDVQNKKVTLENKPFTKGGASSLALKFKSQTEPKKLNLQQSLGTHFSSVPTRDIKFGEDRFSVNNIIPNFKNTGASKFEHNIRFSSPNIQNNMGSGFEQVNNTNPNSDGFGKLPVFNTFKNTDFQNSFNSPVQNSLQNAGIDGFGTNKTNDGLEISDCPQPTNPTESNFSSQTLSKDAIIFNKTVPIYGADQKTPLLNRKVPKVAVKRKETMSSPINQLGPRDTAKTSHKRFLNICAKPKDIVSSIPTTSSIFGGFAVSTQPESKVPSISKQLQKPEATLFITLTSDLVTPSGSVTATAAGLNVPHVPIVPEVNALESLNLSNLSESRFAPTPTEPSHLSIFGIEDSLEQTPSFVNQPVPATLLSNSVKKKSSAFTSVPPTVKKGSLTKSNKASSTKLDEWEPVLDEDEQSLVSVPSILRVFDASLNRYTDNGTSIFYLIKNKNTGKIRVLVRGKGSDKLRLHAYLHEVGRMTKSLKRQVSFKVNSGGKIEPYVATFFNSNDAKSFYKAVQML